MIQYRIFRNCSDSDKPDAQVINEQFLIVTTDERRDTMYNDKSGLGKIRGYDKGHGAERDRRPEF